MATTNTSSDNIRLNQIIDNGLNIYGSREKIRSNLVSYAKKYLNISNDSDISKASYLAYLIDMLSILTSNQIYYQSRLYNEFFLVTANMNESVQNLSKWIGYTIPKAECANASVLFTMPLSFSSSYVNFNFSKYFQVRGGGIPFTIKNNGGSSTISDTSAKVTIDTEKLKSSAQGEIIDNSSVVVRDSDGYPRPVYYGSSEDGSGKYCGFTLDFEQCRYEIQTFTIPSDLQLNQFYRHQLDFEGQIADIQVYVCEPTVGQYLMVTGKAGDDKTQSSDEIQNIETFDPSKGIIDSAGQMCSFKLWTECINGIYTISSTSQQYDWLGYYNKGIISFGNGILGKQPTAGSLVVCVLKITMGSEGNVINNVISEGDSLKLDIGGGETSDINYSVINNNAAFGGKDILSTSELKNNAIVNLKSRKRLVTDDDYENITDVVTDTTLTDCIPILKRSDIKINDISLYFILNYYLNGVNEICPTRNVTIDFREDEIDWDQNNQLTLMKNFEVEVGLDKVPFVTIFNCILNKNTRMATYEYTASNIQGVATELYTNSVSDIMNQNCFIDCKQTNFSIDYTKNVSTSTNKYPVTVQLKVNNIPNKLIKKDLKNPSVPDKSNIDYQWIVDDLFRLGYDDSGQKRVNQFELAHFKCMMVTKWGTNVTYDENSDGYYEDYTIEESTLDNKIYATKKYNSFSFVIPTYTDIPLGKQRYEFYIMGYTPKTDKSGNIYAIRCKKEHPDCGKEYACLDRNGNKINDPDANDRIVMQWSIIKKYYSDVIITQDLSSCMQSSITIDHYKKGIPQYRWVKNPDTGLLEKKYYNVYHLHEVPTIQKKYYQTVMSKDNSDFELTVIQKLMESINFSNKRMMSDFTNIKFADTNGPLTNLRYNKYSYEVESRYINTPWWNSQEKGYKNPPEGIILNEEYEKPKAEEPLVYYVINGKVDQFSGEPTTDYIGYIAIRIPTFGSTITYSYTKIKPELGMIIKIKDELDTEGYEQTCIWNGRDWISVEKYNIPLELKIKVEVDEDTVAKSDDAIKQSIIETLSEYYNDSTKMGLQKQLDISEIIRVCRSVEGVEYVEVQNPEFDIKFDYNIKSTVFDEMNDLTQEQLLNFTPQYVGFRTVTDTNNNYEDTTIDVEVVRK